MRLLYALFLFLPLYLLPQTVHVVGDSHSLCFSLIPGCSIHWLGPITMHRVGRDGPSLFPLAQFPLQEKDALIFCFGEIDVRCHVGKQRDLFHRDEEEILDTLAQNYLRTITAIRSSYQNVLCLVSSVTPPTDSTYNHEYPYYGTLSDRVTLTQKLNEKLSILCKQQDVLFLDTYADYSTAQGTLNPSLSDGSVHIHRNHAHTIKQKLFELLAEEKQ